MTVLFFVSICLSSRLMHPDTTPSSVRSCSSTWSLNSGPFWGSSTCASASSLTLHSCLSLKPNLRGGVRSRKQTWRWGRRPSDAAPKKKKRNKKSKTSPTQTNPPLICAVVLRLLRFSLPFAPHRILSPKGLEVKNPPKTLNCLSRSPFCQKCLAPGVATPPLDKTTDQQLTCTRHISDLNLNTCFLLYV